MAKVLELSEATYRQLADLAKYHQRTLEEMLRRCLEAYEEAQYQQAHQQMIAAGAAALCPAVPGGRHYTHAHYAGMCTHTGSSLARL